MQQHVQYAANVLTFITLYLATKPTIIIILTHTIGFAGQTGITSRLTVITYHIFRFFDLNILLLYVTFVISLLIFSIMFFLLF